MNLIEVLSEKTCPHKRPKPTSRIHAIENAGNALKFIFEDCGVELKLKPQGTDLVDGNESSILALTWAIMLKFLKFGDDEENLNAKDALLMWVKNKVSSYGIKVDGFGKDFHDGLALCAIIHKHRPRLIQWETLTKENARDNIQLAFDAAEKYFGLEKYITVDEFLKLDENSMVVYVSEYFYGIAEQRKLDIAARRIGKLIRFTKENDAMRAEFNDRSKSYLELLRDNEKILEDRTIDNTMAGAKNRLEQFYDYKANAKNQIIEHQLSLESLYTNLAMRLAHANRPEFIPAEGCSLKEISAAIDHLETCEQERKVALHAELNRQIRLAKQNEQHISRVEALKVWIGQKKVYLDTKKEVESVSAAELQLALLNAYVREVTTIKERNVKQLVDIATELSNEKFEYIADVEARNQEIHSLIEELGQSYNLRLPVAEDDLTREKFKEEVRGKVQQHSRKYEDLLAWISVKDAYLQTKEEVSTVADARRHLSNLNLYDEEANRSKSTSVAELKSLGEHILAQEYKTQYSEWRLEDPSTITNPEADVDAKFDSLASLSSSKRQVLDADLERELEKERLRLEWANLVNEYATWTKDVVENVVTFAHFGFTLEEVEAYVAQLDQSDSELRQESSKKVEELTKVDQQLKALNVTDNVYSAATLDDVSATTSTLEENLGKRREAYEEELRVQRENDAICKEFANRAEPLASYIAERKDTVTSSKGSFDEQFAYVEGLIADLPSQDGTLASIEEQYKKIEERNITYNRHTILTWKDVEVQWDQYKIFLERKHKMLSEAIENEKLKGVTQEQLQEIESNFQQFDADGNAKINSKELKACLYSLGEEKGQSEIEKILKEHGDGSEIGYEGFKEFMINVYGDADTKDEILAGFHLINRGEEHSPLDRLQDVLSEEDVQYITTTAPNVEGKYDYRVWVEDVYSR